MITAGCAFLGALAAWESRNALPVQIKRFRFLPLAPVFQARRSGMAEPALRSLFFLRAAQKNG